MLLDFSSLSKAEHGVLRGMLAWVSEDPSRLSTALDERTRSLIRGDRWIGGEPEGTDSGVRAIREALRYHQPLLPDQVGVLKAMLSVAADRPLEVRNSIDDDALDFLDDGDKRTISTTAARLQARFGFVDRAETNATGPFTVRVESKPMQNILMESMKAIGRTKEGREDPEFVKSVVDLLDVPVGGLHTFPGRYAPAVRDGLKKFDVDVVPQDVRDDVRVMAKHLDEYCNGRDASR